jgi:EAL and modified HD-GYP domain-containing signal transduction protein
VTAASTAPASFYLGRQPILDRKGDTVAYELLFRSGAANSAVFRNHREATTQVVTRAFSELGLASVLGSHLGFLNCDAEMLASDLIRVLPPQQIVLELLENIEINDALIENCRALHAKGFHFALDDITALEPGHHALLPYVTYVKVEVSEMPNDSIAKLVTQIKPLGLTLLAEKVETPEQAAFCASLGFECFQGYYFAQPQVLRGKAVEHSELHLLRLMRLAFAEGDLDELEEVFKQDPKLTYNLLRLVNSVAMGAAGARGDINSISQAIMMLGRRQLRAWLCLLMFAHKGTGHFPNPLVILAACRGKTLERLAALEGGSHEDQDKAYVTGMMSLMDVALDLPLSKICDELRLSIDIRDALLRHQGRLGCHLDLVEATEKWDAALIMALLERLQLNLEQWTAVQIEAMTWANGIGKE